MAVAIVMVQVAEEDAMVIPEAPDVAKVPAKKMVRSAERSPPPASPVPVFTALVDETMVKPNERVRSAERSPPPWIPPEVLIVLVEETIVKPKEKAPV